MKNVKESLELFKENNEIVRNIINDEGIFIEAYYKIDSMRCFAFFSSSKTFIFKISKSEDKYIYNMETRERVVIKTDIETIDVIWELEINNKIVDEIYISRTKK